MRLMHLHRISAHPLRSADASDHMTLRTAGDEEIRRTGDARSRLHISISTQESHVTGCKGRGADALQGTEQVRYGRRAVGFESSARLLVHNVDFCRSGSADAARTTVHQAVL